MAERYMDAGRAEDLIEPLLWIGGAIALYYLWSKTSGVVANITAPITNAAADAYVSMTAGGAATPSGNVVLPDGTSVPVAKLTPTIDASGDTTVSYGGSKYVVLPGTDSNGDWNAVVY